MKKAFVLSLAVCLFLLTASATDVTERQRQVIGIDELIDKAPSDVKIEIDGNTSLDEGLKYLWERVCDEAGEVFTGSLSCMGIILTVSMLSAIVASIQGETTGKAPRYMDIVAAVSISASASGSISTFIGMAEDAILSMSDFSKVLFPTLAASVAVSGAPTGAVVRHSASVFFSGTLISLISAVLVPLLYTYIASATANAALERAPIGKICSLLEWIITGSLKVILTAFLAYISISGFVASTVDMAGAKTISAISGAIPVVGKILSGATDTLLTGAKVLKNAVGVFGLISVMSICLSPCLVLFVNYFVFKIAGAVLAPICDVKIGELVGKLATAFGIMLAITAACALLLFIAIISCMFAVGIT